MTTDPLDILTARTRAAFRDIYEREPELRRYLDTKDGTAFDGVDEADLPADHPDSFDYRGL